MSVTAQQMGSGTGGSNLGGTGLTPGGAGGSNNVAFNPPGAIGRVRIIFYG
jgi:hypothetical protein